jgi:Pyridoxamine 5'-phosphate oxidase
MTRDPRDFRPWERPVVSAETCGTRSTISGGRHDGTSHRSRRARDPAIRGLPAVAQSGWSVVVTGFTEEVESEDEIRRLVKLGLRSWGQAANDPHWIRIRPTSVTGRRTPGTALSG